MTTVNPAQRTLVADPRRWWALGAVSTAQLMIGLDLTVMNIALPSVQTSLDLSDPGRQWVITAFALGYGSLLLLGGRLSNLLGRRRSLLIGLTGFALASALGGAATGPAMTDVRATATSVALAVARRMDKFTGSPSDR